MQPVATPSVALWPPDDTEESVLGTAFHQGTIGNVRFGINEAATAATLPGQAVPWQAGSQGLILGLRRRDGSQYQVLPDVFVYRHSFDIYRGSLSLAQDGPPALVVEMLSDATWESDVNLEEGKAWSYGDAGVAEYLILDPGGEHLQNEQSRGWRLTDGVHTPWERDARGRWVSALGFAVGYDGPWAMVLGRDGRLIPREGQVLRLLDTSRAEGRIEGARTMLLRVLTTRFGSPSAHLTERVEALGGLASLEAATEAALHASDVGAFIALLESAE